MVEKAKKLEREGMVYFPAARFMMGSRDGIMTFRTETPRHEVELSAFSLDVHGVTNAEYNAYLAKNSGQRKYKDEAAKGNPSPEGFDGRDQPVVGVSWDEAKAYCEAQAKRLPTEAEWERAAWGMTKGYDTRRKYGTRSGQINSQEAVYNSSRTAPVCSKPKNDAGLCDMAGNTWQWVADWYDGDYYKNSPAKDPKGPATGTYKVLRGGGWGSIETYLSASLRYYFHPAYLRIGFRCASSEDFR